MPTTSDVIEDYRPQVNRTTSNVISKTETTRDRIHDFFMNACKEEKVDTLILKSQPYSSVVLVTCVCWKTRGAGSDLTDRCEALLTIEPREFRRYPYEITLEVVDGHRDCTITHIVAFEDKHARSILRYLLRRSNSLDSFVRCRKWPWQLWRPRNKITRVKRNIFQVMGSLLIGAGFLVVCGGHIIQSLVALLIGSGMALLGILSLVIVARQRTYAISSGKPLQEPRSLVPVDSWQVLLLDLGKIREEFKAKLKDELKKAAPSSFQLEEERIWGWGVDGKEEREQLAITFRRSIGFLHVYTYGNDLYVGWDAHLNYGVWNEVLVGKGIDPQTGLKARLLTVEASWLKTNEYDVMDINCLIEWIHGAMTKVAKWSLARHQIDQDVDFKVLRGDRQWLAMIKEPRAEKSKGSMVARIGLQRQA